MAHSSDRNDSKRNDEDGSTQAEQILDSIIEHIESADDSVTRDNQTLAEAVQSDDAQASAALFVDEQQEQKVSGHDSNSDFKNIEKRAAALASKLGGAGLSYSKGVKKHLEQLLEPEEQKVERETPVVKAAIHQDDLEFDKERFDLSHRDEPELARQEPGELSEAQVIQQQVHVSEWDAELQAKGGIETTPPLDVELSEVDLSIPDAQIETARAPSAVVSEAPMDRSKSIEMIKQSVEPVELEPELQHIERNIEALSSSMNANELDPIVKNADIVDEPAFEVLATPIIPLDEMDLRISTLETNIVKLLDDVSLSEGKMGDLVRDIVRTQTQEAVRESLEISDVFGAMKAELAQAAEQRHLQDVRMSDSLDALHDALQDVGDRVKAMESGSPIGPKSAEMKIPTGAGIVSSVLGSSMSLGLSAAENEYDEASGISDSTTQISNKGSEPAAPTTHDELPAWLSDATQDLHADQLDAPVESADVFAPIAKQFDGSLDKVIVADVDGDVAEKLNPNQTVELENIAPSSVGEQAPQPKQGIEQMFVEPDVEGEEIEKAVVEQQTTQVVADTKNELPAGNDFLRSARVAARAANERAHEIELTHNSADRKSKSIAKIGDFIEAAKQKDTGVESEPVVEKVKPAPKNSLFANKVQGPNSLLVFTSLILFGTSALLLYGMSRESVDTGSIVKLNAVEKTAKQKSIGSGNEIGSSGKFKSKANKKPQRAAGDERSELGSKIVAAAVRQANASSGSDTLTDRDKINSSRTVVLAQEPNAIRYTASTGRANNGVEPGSLFDQYISFSAPSSASDQSGVKSLNTVSKAKVPVKIGGPTGLLNSASGGDAEAQYEIARRFGQGIGVQKSPAISVEWYEKSAKAGYAPAIYRLATMYERGKGVAKDYNRAMKLYMSAANKGNVKAMHNLAVLYTGGNLGKTDYSNAVNWYRKAAQYGVKDSQFNLAIIYQNGMGGKLDLEQAYKWYSLAARAGDKEAKGMVDDLRRELPSAKRKKLDENIRNWKPKSPDKNANVVSQYRKASLSGTTGKKT